MKKNILICHYGEIIKQNNRYYTNSNMITYFRSISKNYYVTIAAPITEKENYKNRYKSYIDFDCKYYNLRKGNFIYNNISLLFLSFSYYLTYIFLPSKQFILIALLNFKTKIISYIGSDFTETFVYRNYRLKFLIPSIVNLYLIIEKIMVKRSVLTFVTGQKLHDQYKKYNVHKVTPITDLLDLNQNISKDFSSKRFLFCSGKISKQKGIISLIDSLKKLSSKIKIDVVGEWPEYEEPKIGLKNIDYHGYVTDKLKRKNFYLNARTLLILSKGEGFPRVIYEGILNRCLILSTRIESIEKNLKGFKIFFINDRDNITEVSKKIKQLYQINETDFKNITDDNLKLLKNLFKDDSGRQFQNLTKKI